MMCWLHPCRDRLLQVLVAPLRSVIPTSWPDGVTSRRSSKKEPRQWRLCPEHGLLVLTVSCFTSHPWAPTATWTMSLAFVLAFPHLESGDDNDIIWKTKWLSAMKHRQRPAKSVSSVFLTVLTLGSELHFLFFRVSGRAGSGRRVSLDPMYLHSTKNKLDPFGS